MTLPKRNIVYLKGSIKIPQAGDKQPGAFLRYGKEVKGKEESCAGIGWQSG